MNFALNKNLAIIAVANFCAVLRAAFHFPIMILKHYPAVSFFSMPGIEELCKVFE